MHPGHDMSPPDQYRDFPGVGSVLVQIETSHSDEVAESFGKSSIFAQLISTLSSLECSDFTPIRTLDSLSGAGVYDLLPSANPSLPSELLSKVLLNQYYYSIDLLMPIIGQETLCHMLDSVYQKITTSLRKEEAEVLLYLVSAISLWLLGKEDPRLRVSSRAYFEAALEYCYPVSRLLSDETLVSLQSTLLICVYLLLVPAAGNSWRMMGHACRMCLKMARHNSSHERYRARKPYLYRTVHIMDW